MDHTLYFYLLLVHVPLLYLIKASFGSRHRGLRLPPGPWQLPVIGSLYYLVGVLPQRAMRYLSRLYGPVMLLRFGEVPVVVASSAEAAKEVMRTHDAVFATRPQTVTAKILSKRGQGIVFAPYGDHWRQLRKICVLEILNAKRVHSFRPIREEEAARLVRSVSSTRTPLVNLSRQLAAYVTDAAVRAVVGDRFKDRDAFLSILDEGVRVAAGFSLADLFPSSRLARALSRVARRAELHRDAFLVFMDGVINEHLERTSHEEAHEEDLIDVVLRLQREDGLQFPLSMGTIKSVIIDVLSAGSETAATTLQWAMAELMRNPSAMSKAQREVQEAFEGQTKVTEEGLSELSYLQWIIKETFRLHPPAPLLMPRECQEPCCVLGYDVPKGTMVFVNAWAISTDPKNWDDAEACRPERFEGVSIDFRGNDFELIPLGAGRRICPGMSFALANIELALASLLFHL